MNCYEMRSKYGVKSQLDISFDYNGETVAASHTIDIPARACMDRRVLMGCRSPQLIGVKNWCLDGLDCTQKGNFDTWQESPEVDGWNVQIVGVDFSADPVIFTGTGTGIIHYSLYPPKPLAKDPFSAAARRSWEKGGIQFYYLTGPNIEDQYIFWIKYEDSAFSVKGYYPPMGPPDFNPFPFVWNESLGQEIGTYSVELV